jgi:hypothetical protein
LVVPPGLPPPQPVKAAATMAAPPNAIVDRMSSLLSVLERRGAGSSSPDCPRCFGQNDSLD